MHRGRVMAGQEESKNVGKRKSARNVGDSPKLAVATSSPNAFPSLCQSNIANSGSGSVVSRRWMTTSLVLNVVFISALLYQRNPYGNYRELDADVSANPLSSLCRATSQIVAGYDHSCSGHGHFEHDVDNRDGNCKCHACFTGSKCSEFQADCVINLDHGDPNMFEDYWLANRDATTTIILGWQRMSYFANTKDVCWFLEPQLAKAIRALHTMVGNAITGNHHIVVGTGSTQLFHAALFALSPTTGSKSINVVSAVPFYSSYPLMTEYLQSGVYRWAGDASVLKADSNDSYIELVTSPNNPDGTIRYAVVDGTGHVIYDLAYYWPHFTPIVSPANHDIMLFSVSKSTGHAGTRIGWALIKDVNVAKRMVKFIELNTIGVSKDSQLRATRILNSITRAYTHRGTAPYKLNKELKMASVNKLNDEANYHYLFHHAYSEMESRWRRLRAAVNGSDRFSIQDFPAAPCSFFGESTIPHPAFAWIQCEKEEDCFAVFKAEGILTRSGIYFGAESRYVRLSMLDRSLIFDILVDRLTKIKFYRNKEGKLEK